MAEIITMPKLSDTMEEGGIARWLKAEGDAIKEGEPLVEIETDKATMEWEAPAGGTLLKILVPAGKTSPLNTPIAVIGKSGEKWDPSALASAAPMPVPTKPSASSSSSREGPPTSATAPVPATPAQQMHGQGRIPASPLARRMAKAQGIDLARVRGSGPNGRVVVRDLAGASQSSMGGGTRASRQDQVVPLTMMRKTIAKRLLAGKNEAPHFYLQVSVDATQLLRWRAELNKGVGEKGGLDSAAAVKVSVNDLLMCVTSRVLAQHPEVNASWEGDQIRQFGSIHLAMAVALPTGLVTPVIRNSDQLSPRDLARAAKDRVERAKQGSLANEDYAGGTFTISNLGMLGIESFTAIINPPQAAILAVGAVRPVVDVDGQRQVVVRDRMTLTLSCDHRVIDGAMGARFLQSLVQRLENPVLLLSE